jgi:hypothetical protein
MTEAASVEWLIDPLKRLHSIIRDAVVKSFERSAIEDMAAIAREEEGDTIYAVDRVSEELLIDFFMKEIASVCSVVLIAEGLPSGKVTLPAGINEEEAKWRIHR